MNDFLPENYTVADRSNGYMRFQQGENRFRVLDNPVLGYEWWIEDESGRKPVRVPRDGKVPAEFSSSFKEFWAMPVWNYNKELVQILEITQKGIMKVVANLARNPKWGSPKGYDLVVDRQGEGLETEYSVTPEPKEELSKEIAQVYAVHNINLAALYEGKDPFGSTNTSSEKQEEVDSEDLPF